MNSIFFSSQEFPISFLGEWYMEGRGNFSSNCYISVHFDNTECACEICLALEQLLSFLRRHFPGFSFEENIAALSCYHEAVPGTEWQDKRGSNQLSTPLSSLFLYFSALAALALVKTDLVSLPILWRVQYSQFSSLSPPHMVYTSYT